MANCTTKKKAKKKYSFLCGIPELLFCFLGFLYTCLMSLFIRESVPREELSNYPTNSKLLSFSSSAFSFLKWSSREKVLWKIFIENFRNGNCFGIVLWVVILLACLTIPSLLKSIQYLWWWAGKQWAHDLYYDRERADLRGKCSVIVEWRKE